MHIIDVCESGIKTVRCGGPEWGISTCHKDLDVCIMSSQSIESALYACSFY